MREIGLIAQHEFWKNVRKRSFLFAVFGAPLLMGGIFTLVFVALFIAETRTPDIEAVGYVDESEILFNPVEVPEGWVAYETEEAARAAIINGEIGLYFQLPLDYVLTGRVNLYSEASVPEIIQDEIETFIANNLAAFINTDLSVERLRDPIDQVVYLENNGRRVTQAGILGLFFVPVLFVMVIYFGLNLSATYLMSGVVDEKKNRIMEILVSTVKPYQLLTGKLIGLGGIGMVQLGVWLVIGSLGFFFFGDSEFLSAVSFPLDQVLIAIAYFLLTYLFIGGILVGIGVVLGEEEESRQYAGLLSVLMLAPIFFISLVLTNPTSNVLTFLRFFPFTAATTTLLLTPFIAIPWWEYALSLGLLAASSVLTIWAAARLFRWGLLMYGKNVNLRTIIQVIRSNPETGVLPGESSNKEKNNPAGGAA